MRQIWKNIAGEPALISGAIMAIINLLALFGVWNPTPEQLGGVNTAVAAILALVVRASVTPLTRNGGPSDTRDTKDLHRVG
jgi:uncharacterized membrane protein YkgB